MRGVTAVALAAVLIAVFLGLVAMLVIQEGPKWRFRTREPYEYVLTDASRWVWARLSENARGALRQSDVLRILEWQVFYLQESVKGVPRGAGSVIVGDTPEAIAFIVEGAASQNAVYPPEVVGEVLEHEATYLQSIGAVAEPVKEDEK